MIHLTDVDSNRSGRSSEILGAQLINQLIDYLNKQLINYYCNNYCLITSYISSPSIFITRSSFADLIDHVRRHCSIIIEPNADVRKHWNLQSQDSLPFLLLFGNNHVSYYLICGICLRHFLWNSFITYNQKYCLNGTGVRAYVFGRV